MVSAMAPVSKLAALIAGLLLPVHFAVAAVFDISNGDITALKAAITAANTNNEDDVINLHLSVVGGYSPYSLTTVDHDTGTGPTGLPMIVSDGGHKVTINGNGATITRDFNANLSFRILEVGSGASVTLHTL